MKNKFGKRICLLMAALILITCLTGCTSAGQDLLQGFVQEWINTKFGIDTTSTNPFIKGWAGLRLVALFNQDSTGNADSDAALSTAKMLKNFAQAENLMAHGRENNDPTLMEQAITLRPTDWSYRTSREMLAVEQGDLSYADYEHQQADTLVSADKNNSAYKRFDTQVINEYEKFGHGSEFDSSSNNVKMEIYYELWGAYSDRFRVTHDPNDNYNAITYHDKYKALGGSK